MFGTYIADIDDVREHLHVRLPNIGSYCSVLIFFYKSQRSINGTLQVQKKIKALQKVTTFVWQLKFCVCGMSEHVWHVRTFEFSRCSEKTLAVMEVNLLIYNNVLI